MRRRSWLFFLFIWTLMGGVLAAAPVEQEAFTGTFVFDARADLELVADEVFGTSRPDTWTGNFETDSPTVVADLWFDNEQMAEQLFGTGIRPPEWIGTTGSNAQLIARNVRHDVELAADEVFGLAVRPDTWRGADPLVRCSRTTQNVLLLLQQFYSVTTSTPSAVLDYCRTVSAEVEDDLVDAVFQLDDEAQLPNLILAIRGDIERLADERLGLNNRPPAWIGNKDVGSVTLAGDIFLDLEVLADALLGDGVRPPEWIGAITNNAATTYLNLRHDLELLGDATLGIAQRPNGWQGVDPILRCEPLVQNLILLVQQNYDYAPPLLDPTSETYCDQLELSANTVAENPPIEDVVQGDDRLAAESKWAFTYLDAGATQFMGIMPGGTLFRAWYRNYGDSSMMFVSGDDFALYVDYHFTTLPPQTFDSLPTTENVRPITFCDAAWCNGPGPTPTPTGFGALNEIVLQITPPAPSDGTQGPGGTVDQTLVTWNNIRVTYVQDNPAERTAQVALEICNQPAAVATACEPVTLVTDAATGAAIASVTQFNGLNVYEFRYGYTTSLVISGQTLFSNDIWISDPTIR